MKRSCFRLIALALVLTLLLSGCSLDFAGYFKNLAALFAPVSFANMTYTRPDLSRLEGVLEDCVESAAGKDLDALVGHINTFNSICNHYNTNYYLAYIHYCIDMSDAYWEAEYDYCAAQSTQVQAAIDELMYALAESPLRSELEGDNYFGAGYFDDYDGESLWTEAFTALMDREAELIRQYYSLSAKAGLMETWTEAFYNTVGAEMEQLYVELVLLRRQIAQEAGYESYPEFAYDFYYDRDYTPAQTAALLKDIRLELVDEYEKLGASDIWTRGLQASAEYQTRRYVKTMAQSMGGMIADAYELMEDSELYHISHGENKFDGSFEVFLPNYGVPYIFVNPTLTNYDHLTFAHEFGHFCHDYASYGTMAGVDVAEIFSQGMEYLSLQYADGGQSLVAMKLADSLCVYVEQAALADFEARVYSLEGDLTAAQINQLYGQVAEEYGYGDLVDSRSYVTIPHLYTSPLYVISYVVSNDAAMQLYQMELEKPGSGLDCYRGQLATEQTDFLTFVKWAQLTSPFEEGRIQSVKELFRKELKL